MDLGVNRGQPLSNDSIAHCNNKSYQQPMFTISVKAEALESVSDIVQYVDVL